MSYGSSKAMRAYVNTIFGIEDALRQLKDARRRPTVSFIFLMTTWFWAMVKRLPSSQQVGTMLADRRWQRRMGVSAHAAGSADTAARVLDGLDLDEINALLLDMFFKARRAGILTSAGPYGQRCVMVDMNELFKSETVHCGHCQVRLKTVGEGENKRQVAEYYHQAVALVWAEDKRAWPIGWEILAPGEGELTAALRLLNRLLPALHKSIDLVLGDALYCCRPFFKCVRQNGVHGMAICSGVTEMDDEMVLLMTTETPNQSANNVQCWVMLSEAWARDVGGPLRILQYANNAPSKPYKHERKKLRLVTTATSDVLPDPQGWQIGRSRWVIENGAFNLLTRDYALTHNYRHNVAAIAALLMLRSLALCLMLAYWSHATARTSGAPNTVHAWWTRVLVEDWVRYLEDALRPPNEICPDSS